MGIQCFERKKRTHLDSDTNVLGGGWRGGHCRGTQREEGTRMEKLEQSHEVGLSQVEGDAGTDEGSEGRTVAGSSEREQRRK